MNTTLLPSRVITACFGTTIAWGSVCRMISVVAKVPTLSRPVGLATVMRTGSRFVCGSTWPALATRPTNLRRGPRLRHFRFAALLCLRHPFPGLIHPQFGGVQVLRPGARAHEAGLLLGACQGRIGNGKCGFRVIQLALGGDALTKQILDAFQF